MLAKAHNIQLLGIRVREMGPEWFQSVRENSGKREKLYEITAEPFTISQE
jgi:hypothetical protein